MGAALQGRLAPFLLGTQDQSNEVQPKSIRVLKVPDYFAEYRDKGDGLASFLGASIVAKVRNSGINNSRLTVSSQHPPPDHIHRLDGKEFCFKIGLCYQRS